MGLAPELKLVIKHTFLEYVGDGEKASPSHRRTRPRAVTDPSTFDDLCYGEVRSHFHDSDDSTDLASSSSSGGSAESAILQASSSNYMSLPMPVSQTPEGTPLQCPVAPFLSSWLEEEWSLGFLPEAADQHCVWPEHFGEEQWHGWASMPYDSSILTTGDCNHQLATIYEQYNVNCESMEQAYGPVDNMDVSQIISPHLVKEEPAPLLCGAKEIRTTVMLRDLPENFTRTSLLRLLDAQGFFGRFDFLYLPVDFKRQQNLGYALINLVSPSEAVRFTKHFTGFSQWNEQTDRICSVGWCSPQQGLEAHVDRYRNSPVMHDSVPEEWRPMRLLHGVPIPFPPPTQKIKAPKVKGMNM